MILIYGGAYQGKLPFAQKKYGISERDVFYCTTEAGLDTNKVCVYGWHKFVLSQIRKHTDHAMYLTENFEILNNKLIICDDISQGVVPIDAETRLWREEVGKSVTRLAEKSSEVWRVFCGIGTRLK